VANKRDHLKLVEKGTVPAAETARTSADPAGGVSASRVENGAGPFSEIDSLYQKPLGEFTAARNALAKQLGKAGGDVKTLEKPSAPAWGVNQLFWHERSAYDRLIEAAEALREEHRNHLSGQPADIRQAEKIHRDAVKAASETVRRLLTDAGDAATPATMAAVTETLESLPTSEPPGRLVRPLKPQGFAALAGFAGLAVRPVSQLRPVKSRDGSNARTDADSAAARESEAARRAAEAADRKAEEERQRARAAHAAAVREAEAAVERARAALDEAHQEVERRSEALAAAREALRQLKRAT
jgi:dTMP kinase